MITFLHADPIVRKKLTAAYERARDELAKLRADVAPDVASKWDDEAMLFVMMGLDLLGSDPLSSDPAIDAALDLMARSRRKAVEGRSS